MTAEPNDAEALTGDPLDDVIVREAPTAATRAAAKLGRPRSSRAHREILRAFKELLIEDGFDQLRMEHVAARAKVGKATIYRHWSSKQELALELLMELATPHLAVPDVGDTRTELLATVLGPMRSLTETDYGPVTRELLSEIARNPALGDPFRTIVVQARRDEVARVIARGVRRGDLRPDVEPEVATEMLVGPVYWRLLFGGSLDHDFAERIVDEVLQGWSMRGWGEVATNWL
ncbi:MAG: TetR/AcrR family transcriptional regulator [Chloroflexota bacterium]|jgi:AcrR family transcriptional regulator